MSDPSDVHLTPLARSLPQTIPFVSADVAERRRGQPYAARLGANESGFGPSPAAVEAIAVAASGVWMYGDETGGPLREAIAARHGVSADQVRLGEGVDGLLGLAARLTLAPGAIAVMPEGGYPTFAYHAAGFGARIDRVPYRADQPDLAAMAAAAQRAKAAVVYLANPDNPMGGVYDAAAIRRFLEALPHETLLILDEAYAECAGDAPLLEMACDAPNLLRLRSFSKAYGLAGLRIGYAVGPAALVSSLDRVRNHFGVGRLSQAGALAAFEDSGYLEQTLMRIDACKARLGGVARAHGLTALPSATNFVAIDLGRDGAFTRRVLGALDAQDVFVRMPSVAPLDRCLRVSCGPDAEIALFEQAFGPALAEADAAA